MAKTRSRIVNTYHLTTARIDNKVKSIYFIKNIYYGQNCDTYDYNKVKVSFKSTRSDYKKNKSEEKSDFSLSRARERLFRIVEANKQRHKGLRSVFFTLTTSDQTKEYRQSNAKIKGFIRRLNKYCGFKVKYLIVPERHVSGAIHYHGIFFNLPFIPILTFRREIWGHGSVDLQLPKRIRNISAYISKYLTKDFAQNTPKHTKTFFCSRGLVLPRQELTVEYPHDIAYVNRVEIKPTYIKIKHKLHAKHI